MYQYIITFLALLVCTITDLKEKRIYRNVLFLYFFLGSLGYLTAVFGGDSAIFLEGDRCFWDFVIRFLPGIFCLILSGTTGEALGYGDGLLILICGLCIGAKRTVRVLACALIWSALILLFSCIRDKGKKKEYPFVPFLLAGYLIQLRGGFG